MLKRGVPRPVCRANIEPQCYAVVLKWRGEDDEYVLEERAEAVIVIDDDSDDDSDDGFGIFNPSVHRKPLQLSSSTRASATVPAIQTNLTIQTNLSVQQSASWTEPREYFNPSFKNLLPLQGAPRAQEGGLPVGVGYEPSRLGSQQRGWHATATNHSPYYTTGRVEEVFFEDKPPVQGARNQPIVTPPVRARPPAVSRQPVVGLGLRWIADSPQDLPSYVYNAAGERFRVDAVRRLPTARDDPVLSFLCDSQERGAILRAGHSSHTNQAAEHHMVRRSIEPSGGGYGGPAFQAFQGQGYDGLQRPLPMASWDARHSGAAPPPPTTTRMSSIGGYNNGWVPSIESRRTPRRSYVDLTLDDED
jgi:hypothetical protein